MINKILKVLMVCSQVINSESLYITRNNFVRTLGGYYTNNIVSNEKTISYYDGMYDDIIYNEQDEQTKELLKETDTKIEKEHQTPLTINYYGTVSTESCLALTTMLRNLDIKSKELELLYDYRIPIKLHIQSMGGELMPTFYVCDLIKKMDTPVHVYIDGYVASAAATIAVCGHKRYITKHSSMLIHQLKSSSSGKFAELKDEMSNLNMFMMNLEDLYLENTKIEKDELEKLLFSEIWLSADKCLEYGLVDAII